MGHTQLFLFGLVAAAAAAFWYDARIEVNRSSVQPSTLQAQAPHVDRVDRPNIASMR